jgi:hypothetical protein
LENAYLVKNITDPRKVEERVDVTGSFPKLWALGDGHRKCQDKVVLGVDGEDSRWITRNVQLSATIVIIGIRRLLKVSLSFAFDPSPPGQ